jgi:hypothetical protein
MAGGMGYRIHPSTQFWATSGLGGCRTGLEGNYCGRGGAAISWQQRLSPTDSIRTPTPAHEQMDNGLTTLAPNIPTSQHHNMLAMLAIGDKTILPSNNIN